MNQFVMPEVEACYTVLPSRRNTPTAVSVYNFDTKLGIFMIKK